MIAPAHINWRSMPAQLLAMVLLGTALGFLWSLNDPAYSQGLVGWIAFVIIGLPVYLLATYILEKALLSERRVSLAGPTFSWRRVGSGLFVALGTLLVAAIVYFSVKAL